MVKSQKIKIIQLADTKQTSCGEQAFVGLPPFPCVNQNDKWREDGFKLLSLAQMRRNDMKSYQSSR